jgi:hypothetical protein
VANIELLRSSEQQETLSVEPARQKNAFENFDVLEGQRRDEGQERAYSIQPDRPGLGGRRIADLRRNSRFVVLHFTLEHKAQLLVPSLNT